MLCYVIEATRVGPAIVSVIFMLGSKPVFPRTTICKNRRKSMQTSVHVLPTPRFPGQPRNVPESFVVKGEGRDGGWREGAVV